MDLWDLWCRSGGTLGPRHIAFPGLQHLRLGDTKQQPAPRKRARWSHRALGQGFHATEEGAMESGAKVGKKERRLNADWVAKRIAAGAALGGFVA